MKNMDPQFKFENPKRRNDFERNPEEGFEKLFSALADKINHEYCEPGEKNLVLNDGRINMEVFDSYDQEKDEKFIKDIKYENFGINNESIKNFYVSEIREKSNSSEGLEVSDEQIIKYREREQESQLSFRWEKASTVLLSRVLGNDFIVLRSSELDDYTNKTDTVIVDKESGAVICAIDLVNDRAGGDRYEKKLQQLKKDARGGQGGELRFGITVEKDKKTGEKKLVKKELKNIPRFFLPAEENDLRRLLKEMSKDFNAPLIEIEKIIFGKLLNSLEEQKGIYAQNIKQSNISEIFRLNFKKFESSLEKMKEAKNKF